MAALVMGMALYPLPSFPAPEDAPGRRQDQSWKQSAGELKALRTRIRALQRELERTRGKRDTQRERLREVENSIGNLLQSIKTLDEQITMERRSLVSLKRRKKNLQAERGRQVTGLDRQLRAAHAMGGQQLMKLLLNQDDPAVFSRILTYHRYLSSARLERIRKVEATMTQLNEVEREITRRARKLEAVQAKQNEERDALERARASRVELLANLNRQIRSKAEEVARLRVNERDMERLVQELSSQPLEGQRRRTGQGDFTDSLGRLPLPVRGKIVGRYGAPRNIGDLRWRGIFLRGKEGQDVRAVFRGRVTFSDWLRGFGLLLILDHGDGYMTLYAHNQSLYKRAGDWVEAGETIASMGATGDTSGSGLYFEIRHNGEPRDPLLWCRRR